MSGRQTKATQERHERMLLELLKLPGNDRCADCPSKNPRWASYSLGIFLCIRCAGLHRKMGTHISRVKSVTMDQWTPEQIDMIRKAGGNDNVNSKINPHPDRHPLPLADDDGDRVMERYVRNKWEKRAFMAEPPKPPRPTAPSTHNANLQAPQSNSNFPKRSSSVPVLVSTTEEYPTEMARLCEMGFKDDQRNRQVLKHTQGRIDAAVDILSRLPGAPQSPAKPVFLTNEQKMQRLSEMGYSDIPENRDALRRSGGNLEVAVGILQNARKPAAQDNSVATTKPEPLSAFSSTTSNQQNEPAGRAQNSSERQNHTLSGLKTADLLNLLDDGSSNKPAATASNPFHQPAATPMQQQQQQPSYFATSTATNPFGFINNNASMAAPVPSAPMQGPFATGMTTNQNLGFNAGSLQQQQQQQQQPQLTGYQSSPNLSPMLTGNTSNSSSNPFSQMSSSPAVPNAPSPFALPQRSFTAPEFPTLSQQQQSSSPFATAMASSSSSLQIPFQQQQQQQQHTMVPSSSSLSSSPFANAGVPSQPTGFVPMNNGFSPMANTNPAPAANPWAATNGTTAANFF